jgi:hypothetical protein
VGSTAATTRSDLLTPDLRQSTAAASPSSDFEDGCSNGSFTGSGAPGLLGAPSRRAYVYGSFDVLKINGRGTDETTVLLFTGFF